MSTEKQGKNTSLGFGQCPNHRDTRPYTVVIVGRPMTSYTNGLLTSTVKSLGVCSCGHMSVAMTGTDKVYFDKEKSHRVKDLGTTGGNYELYSGAEDQFAGTETI